VRERYGFRENFPAEGRLRPTLIFFKGEFLSLENTFFRPLVRSGYYWGDLALQLAISQHLVSEVGETPQ